MLEGSRIALPLLDAFAEEFYFVGYSRTCVAVPVHGHRKGKS